MKQKILYIILMIIALVGGKGDVWGQSEVDGYYCKDSGPIEFSIEFSNGNYLSDNTIVMTKESNVAENIKTTTTFRFGSNIKSWVAGSGYQLYISKGNRDNQINWSVDDKYLINVTTLSARMKTRLGKGTVTFSPSQGDGTYIEISGGGTNTAVLSCNLQKNDYINVSISGSTTSPYYYVQYLSYTYTLSYYELITTAIDDAITYANEKKDLIDETLREYLTTAIDNANTFIGECAFPNSYWNGSPVGNSPADVTEAAAKLKAIADYLVVRTNASVYKEDEIPNEVYRQLHQYDEYDPNGFDSGAINTAKADIDKAITLAANTTEAYKSVKSAIATAAARTDHNDVAALEADVTKATNVLEAATTVNAINAALSNIKNFDNITFNGPFSVDEGATIDNPANATSGKGVAYSSSDETIVSISGTTLKALKPGTVTITASTSTSDGYYGYTETKEYTITAKPLVLEPTEKCSVNLDVEYPTVTLNRTFTTGHHSTLALPFNTYISDFSESSEAYAAQLSLVTYNQADGYTLYFKTVEGGAMVANQPYVIYLPSTKNSFSWNDVTINSVVPSDRVEGENERFMDWTMQANYTPGLSMEGMYGIAGGKLRKGMAGSTINAYTAYFVPPTANPRVRMAVLDDDGGVTYIDDIRADGEEVSDSEQIYRLDGTRQTTLTKGINIVKMANGEVRKVLK